MNSSKIKNFLIILLAAVNIFLLINLFIVRLQSSQLSGELLQASAQALARNGIYVDAKDIPSQKYTQKVICANSSSKTHLNTAKDVLGKILAEYSLPDGITYQSENAYVSFFDNGRFEYGLLASRDEDGISLSPQPPEIMDEIKGNISKNLKTVFNKFVSKQKNDKLGYIPLGAVKMEGRDAVFAQLCIDGLAIHDGNFIATFEKDTLTYFSGKFFFDSFDNYYTKEYIDAPNALFLLKSKGVSVKNIEMVYYPAVSASSEYFLIPSWQITLDDGTVKLFDGVSGFERR